MRTFNAVARRLTEEDAETFIWSLATSAKNSLNSAILKINTSIHLRTLQDDQLQKPRTAADHQCLRDGDSIGRSTNAF